MIKVKLLTTTAKLPTRGSVGSAGLDIYADQHAVIGSEPETVSTGMSIMIPEGFYGSILPRSGMAFENGIDTLAGVIDSDYRGEIKVLLISHSLTTSIAAGDRIAQLVIQPCVSCAAVEVQELTGTARGSNGFGSTGR